MSNVPDNSAYVSELYKKVVIGTASFDNKYGISNINKLERPEVLKILKLLDNVGVSHLDTAPSYGGSEEAIGSFGCQNFRIYSKFREDLRGFNISSVEAQIIDSMDSLGVSKLEGLTFHSSSELLSSPQMARRISANLEESGLVASWGVSLYDPAELYALLEVVNPKYVQVPLNVIDQRFAARDIQSLLEDRGIGLQARSVFLQGLLLSPRPVRSANVYFAPWDPVFLDVEREALRRGMSIIELSLAFAFSQPHVKQVVLGVNSLSQLEELLRAIADRLQVLHGLDHLASTDQNLIDPRRWPYEK
jgi:aryl-alcohol dehydrogenase-like predicted oxidoreductase